MFREMRRGRQQLAQDECEEILARATSGVLSVLGDDGYPYGVPLSHVFADGTVYLHCALEGHKVDALRAEPKCCFTVVERDDVVEEEYTTRYRSVVAFGHARFLAGDEKRAAALLLANRLSPSMAEGNPEHVEAGLARMEMVAIDVDHLTGKQSRELAAGR